VSYSGEFRILSVNTDAFTYKLYTAVTPASGTCSYTKQASVVNSGNIVVSSDSFVAGNSEVKGNENVVGNLNVYGSLSVAGKTPVYAGEVINTDHRNIDFPLFTAWGQSIWESPTISVPVGETWVYVINAHWARTNNDNGNTRPEIVGTTSIKYGDTTVSTQNLLHSAFSGIWSTHHIVVSLTSDNTPAPIKIKYVTNATGAGTRRNSWTSSLCNIAVTMTKVKTSLISDINNYI
jgi:hypothetical protein